MALTEDLWAVALVVVLLLDRRWTRAIRSLRVERTAHVLTRTAGMLCLMGTVSLSFLYKDGHVGALWVWLSFIIGICLAGFFPAKLLVTSLRLERQLIRLFAANRHRDEWRYRVYVAICKLDRLAKKWSDDKPPTADEVQARYFDKKD